MKQLFLCALVMLLASCNELVQNSNSSDDLKYAFASLPGGSNFKLVVPTIIEKCASCHTHEAWYNYGETDYYDEGLIIPSNQTTSPIYFRLSNAASGAGPRNMPQGGGAAFTDEELELLTNWIDNYGI